MNYSDIVLRKQQRRYQLLMELWKAANGKEHKTVDFMEVAAAAGFNEEEAGASAGLLTEAIARALGWQ
jgi:hypothetical protein